jgi:hypothetical protein
MKIANVKTLVAKGMMAAMVAGAFMIASPVKAQAQGFAVGVEVGYPHSYGRPGFYEFERRQEFLRHEEFLRAHRFYGHYGWR